jgi:hypothetical protein
LPSQPVIVTAADERYWRCLHQFLRDVERRGLQRGHRLLAYDLGLAAATRARLEKRFPWCGFVRFRFEDHPPHATLAQASFAWKPLLLAELAAAHSGPLLWLDSATLFRTRDLAPLWAAIAHDGIYAVRGQGVLRERCDPLTLEALAVPFAIANSPEFVAGVIGFDLAQAQVRALIAEWAAHARIEAHIMPRQPPLPFHNPEQSLLTILLYRAAAAGWLRLGDEKIDISAARPLSWMSSRNKVGAKTPLWADPFIRLGYALYKKADQAVWRWREWRDTRLHGFLRRLKEHYTVLVATADGRVLRVPAPSWCYYADPFLVTHRGRTALLVERFDYRTCRAGLCTIELDAQSRLGRPLPIIPRASHMSFPFVFSHEDELYLVPETCADRTVEIFRCTRFPDAWEPVAIALEDVDAADTVIFPHDGLWWLLTSVRTPGASGRSLAVYHAEDFRTGPWRPHPVNETALYRDLPFWSGRNGGGVFQHDGMLLRPAQHNTRFYGEDLRLMRIETLTPDEYRETPHDGDFPAARIVRDFSPHHLCVADSLMAFDIRDRARVMEGLRPFRLRRRPRTGLAPLR